MMRKSLSPGSLLAEPGFTLLKAFLIESTGLAYYQQKNEELARPVAERMEQLGLTSCSVYHQYLLHDSKGADELNKLIERLTIGETFFFRHTEIFDALRDRILPSVIEQNRDQRRIRIWSAGCSIGAEPYSVAILLKRHFLPLIREWEVTIIGTDVNHEFLSRAREGRYMEWAFRNVPDLIKTLCFTPNGNAWEILPEHREWVSFQYHNLVKNPFPSLVNNLFAFDVILCRNVIIYFDEDTIQKLVQQFYDSLVDNGWLLVGHAEPNLERFRQFNTVNAEGAVLYQKSSTSTPVPVTHPVPVRAAGDWTTWKPPILEEIPATPGSQGGQSGKTDGAIDPDIPSLDEMKDLADAGQLEKAAQLCDELIKRDSLNAVVHFYKATILEQLGDHDRTVEALKRAIYLDRNSVLAHYYLGMTCQKLQQSERAIRSFRNVLNLLSTMKPDQLIPFGDELTVEELQEMTQMHLDVLEQ